MPSSAEVLRARYDASRYHETARRWLLVVDQLGVEKLPEKITHVQLHWRRKGSKKKMQKTALAPVSATGDHRRAVWEEAFTEAASISSAQGKNIPKYYEFVVKGAASASVEPHAIGKLTVDVAQFCTNGASSNSGRNALYQMKGEGWLQVTITATPEATPSLTSQLSLDSELSMMDERLDEDLELAQVGRRSHSASPAPSSPAPTSPEKARKRHHAISPPRPATPFDEDEAEAGPATNPFKTPPRAKVAARNPFDDEELSDGPAHRHHTLPPEDLAYFLRELDSSDGEEPSRRREPRPWNWFTGKRTRQERQERAGADKAPGSPDSVLPSLDVALRVANAGPAESSIDLRRIQAIEDPDVLKKTLRQLMDERNELAYRNWALQATNMCLQAEIDSTAAMLRKSAEQENAARGKEKRLRAKVQKLEFQVEAAQRRGPGDAAHRREAYASGELQDALVQYKTRLAEAEFELLELRQELRSSRRATVESISSSSSGRNAASLAPDSIDESAISEHGTNPFEDNALDLPELRSAAGAVDRALKSASARQVAAR